MRTEVVRSAAAAGRGPGRAISCLRLVGCLSHSFLATVVEEEEGPVTIAMSQVDSLAWRRWWYRFPDVATLALPVSRDAYFVFSLLFVSEDEEGSWMKMSEQRIKGRIRGRYKWIFVARVCSPRRSSYVRSSVNGECC